jgi:HPt (histidine-containing phosphotransfer) domain-containing protein
MRLAHSASGVAGNVGARDLQAAARALEHALRSGARSNLPLVLDAFDIALRTVLDGLAHLDGEPGSRPAGLRFSDRRDRLPAPLLEAMRSAVVRADLDRLVALIAEVEPIDGDMARGLRAGVESLDYAVLQRLLGMDEGAERGTTR